MSTAPMIRWIERAPELHEARATLPDGGDLYVGYVARTPDVVLWRGYVGTGFTPVGMGSLDLMRRVVEQWALDVLRYSAPGKVTERMGG